MHIRQFLLLILLFVSLRVYCQQDVDFHLNARFLQGKTVLKVKRDFNDPYLWVLAKNNEVYRINSLTQAVDNYTPLFAAYNNLQFIDIAGRSKDTVYIATQSPNVIQYQNGNINLIDPALIGNHTVTSVGVDYAGRVDESSSPAFGHILLIGTVNGLYRYNMDSRVSSPGLNPVYSQVFEATYRRDLYSGINYSNYPDTITYYPVQFADQQTFFNEYVWLNAQTFGNNLKTAFYVPYGFNNDSYAYGTDMFWGTEKGLSQVNRDYSYTSVSAHEHYLNNIQVNKITDIFGLSTFGSDQFFGNPGLVKQNLLVGTDQGLYFSNTLFNNFETVGGYGNGLRKFSLFHYDELGTIRVNDICTNLVSKSPSICEDGVWVACDNGLYLIKPDYAKYLSSGQFEVIGFKGRADSLSSVKICTVSSVTAMINTDLYSGNSIQWYKAGNELPAASKDSLVINTTGDYYAVLYDPCENIHMESNHLQVQVVAGPVFTFNYPDNLQYCKGQALTLKAVGDPSYQYRWYKNDTLNGVVNQSLSVLQSGKYKVEVSACEDSWVPSKEVQVDLIDLPVPVITADKPGYCIGDNATLSVAVPQNPDYTINWYRDGLLLTASINQVTLNTAIAGSYTVSIVNNQVNTDGTNCTQTSAVQSVQFDPLPTVSIQKIVKTTLCDGQTVDLKVTYDAGTVKWSTGDSGDQITVSSSGTYTATVTTPAGCVAEASTSIQFFTNPVLNIQNVGICMASHKTVTITAPAGFASYTWNGQNGSESYTADRPQKVTLIVTDNNGCQATQEIQVTDECPDVVIPNAFTPNGDGINDTWDISGLAYDPTVLVRIFDRYGQQVYQSRGYGTPWNGEYHGKKLPQGVFYYVINAKNNSQTYSGSLTILY
ncbi:gliding motility-associated C-terminal domain-containing protein [Mucilaginibacter sp. McL0603]|uniref:T9SS type B sorting domain-containing protein n=1 Tax=Mucilaginibacter sp. McL0603 TaxID=3415670 RepID=UPI003CE9C806